MRDKTALRRQIVASSHLFHFSKLKPSEETEGGSRTKATKENFPMLSGMSLYKLVLQPGGIREPHWHVNADELGYCLKGKALVTLYHTGDQRASFAVLPGQIFLIPSGALHTIENRGEDTLELLLEFSHDMPEDFGLTRTMGTFTNAVLGNTWHVEASVFDGFKRCKTDPFATVGKERLPIPDSAFYATPYRYDVEGAMPVLEAGGGSARMARQNFWPILKRQALYALTLTGSGMREPHWHPETQELGFVKKGRGRMSILDPTGAVDTYIMEEGDIYFIPKAYPHHIENLEREDLHLLIFFDQAMPGDIGLTASVRSISDEVLSSSTRIEADILSRLPKYYRDLFIVDKVNPQDRA